MIICLDAGHGGNDPGACGHNGLHEADVNLNVVKNISKILKNSGVEVVYTREDDVKVDLTERSNISNREKCDYFISIHCNAAGTPNANGTETLVYKFGGEAEKLAKLVNDNLINEIKLANRGVKEQNVSVLRKTDCPAILIELAFISNLNEEKLLSNSSFQNRCSQSIANSILKFIGKEGENMEINFKVPEWQLEACKQFCNRNGLDTKLWLAKTESKEPLIVGELFGILNKVIK